MKENVVINGRHVLINQLIIGIVPTVILIVGAFWAFGADFAAMKTTQLEHKTSISNLETDVKAVHALEVQLVEIKTIVEIIRDEQHIIREKIEE